MFSTLKEAMKLLQTAQAPRKSKGKVADGLLGKYEGIIPQGKTSTEYVRELRAPRYGKIKK
jgi:hypothetical protein